MEERGSDASVFINLMKRHGYNKNMDIEVGKTISVTPLIIDLSSNLSLDKDDVTLAERLVTDSPLAVGDLVILIADLENHMYYAIDKVGGL